MPDSPQDPDDAARGDEPVDPFTELFRQLGGQVPGGQAPGAGQGGSRSPGPIGSEATGNTGGSGGSDGGAGGGAGGLGDLFAALSGGAIPGAGGPLGPGGIDPAELMAKLQGDPAAMAQVMGQVQKMMASAGDGPVNMTLAHDLARQRAVTGGDPSPGEKADRDVAEALRLADLWLGPVTDFASPTARTRAWSRSQWVEATMPTWQRLVEPVASSVADAVASAMAEQAPEEMRGMLAGVAPMMRSLGGSVFGMQLGQAIGGLAREVVSTSDVGLPLTDGSVLALVVANVEEFAQASSVPVDEVRLFLALREDAHARLFAHVPWLRSHLVGAVEQYARGIVIDTSRIEEAVSRVDPSDPAALQEALRSGMFEPERTPTQVSALDRLETSLALVEGWVDEVTAAAASALPHADALRESVRRRRATGGPAEAALTSLVGLQLRPRRLRDAARLFSVLASEGGSAARDGVWSHPDLLPTSEDLDAPEGYSQRRGAAAEASADVDAELAAMLDGSLPGVDDASDGDSAGPGDGDDAGPEGPASPA